MAVIWIIEKGFSDQHSITAGLIGNYPIRAFASYRSFCKLLAMKRDLPDLVLVDLESCDEDFDKIDITLKRVLEGISVAYIASSHQESTLCDDAAILPKTSSHLELVRQVRSLLARSSTRTLAVGDMVFDLETFSITLVAENRTENLPLKEAQILKLLIENKNLCVSRQKIKEKIWAKTSVSSRTIDSHISRLRKRLVSASISIDSVYGNGYMLHQGIERP